MTKYGDIESRKPENPPIALRRVPSVRGDLIVSPAFGSNTYKANIAQMQRTYSHDSEDLGNHPRFTFNPATTFQSLDAVAYNFAEDAKPKIFDSRWLQAGPVVRTPEGVFTNTQETDDVELRKMLAKVKKVNRIYLINDKIAYAPYESFTRGIQDAGDFAINLRTNGLARALEHSRGKKAKNLTQMLKSYTLGVNVWGFEPTDKPVSMVVGLPSYWDADGGRLGVGGVWCDNGDGCAFGVSDFVAEGDAPKNQ
nr:hypothetical protein [uncultured archaeon]AQS33472.1 hypothetical protein [uncultured archaeon]